MDIVRFKIVKLREEKERENKKTKRDYKKLAQIDDDLDELEKENADCERDHSAVNEKAKKIKD